MYLGYSEKWNNLKSSLEFILFQYLIGILVI